MRWMGGWNRFDLEAAWPQQIEAILRLIEEENEQAAKSSHRESSIEM